MAIVSVGYAGTVTDADWRRLARRGLGLSYSVDGFEDWKVSAAVGDRMVSVAAGAGSGFGVYDVSDAAETLQHGAAVSGTRWDLVVARRDWDLKTTTFAIVPGSAAKAIPARATGYGTVNEQPIALVRVDAGATSVQEIIDLRCTVGDGGVLAWDDLARQYLDLLGTSVRIGDVIWDRVTNSSGSPMWVSSDMSDTGWVAVPRGPGWTANSQYPLQIRRIGALVELRGLVGVGPTASISNMATIPAAFRTGAPLFLGAMHAGYSTGNHVGDLNITTGGVVNIPPRYYTGSLGVGAVVPINGMWLLG